MNTNLAASPQPSTQVQAPLVLDVAALRANPQAIASERQTRTVLGGILLAGLGAGIGYLATRRSPSRTTGLLVGTALGGALGVALGQFTRTREEAYSEILTDAAKSGNFPGHVKKEMQRREDTAFIVGALTGFPIWF